MDEKGQDERYCGECNSFHERLPRGFGVYIGVNDRAGRPIRIGDVLRFDEKQWGAPMTFQVELREGMIMHPGSTSDLEQWCTIIPACCVIGCGKPAEFEIAGGSGHFEDFTHACEDHVGELLGTPDWLDEENREWTVTVMEGE